MKLHQLSLFLENKPGQLSIPCRALGKAGINIVTLSLADTQQFGILRLIVRDWQSAKKVLEDAGCVVNVVEVVAIEVVDRPGGMGEFLEVLENAGMNIEYMYAFSTAPGQQAVVIIRFSDPDRALAELQRRGLNVVEPVKLLQG